MNRFKGLVFGLAFVVLPAIAQAQSLDVGTWDGSGCCSWGGTRGYFFTAPTAFTITGLSVASGGTSGTLEVLRLTAPPPYYASTTNAFTSLFYSATTSASGLSIGINAGDYIGVLGYDNSYEYTPYGSAYSGYASSILGDPVSLYRFGFQFLGPAHDVWQEEGGQIGVINMEYAASGPVTPEPATWLLLGTGLFGVGLVGLLRRTA